MVNTRYLKNIVSEHCKIKRIVWIIWVAIAHMVIEFQLWREE